MNHVIPDWLTCNSCHLWLSLVCATPAKHCYLKGQHSIVKIGTRVFVKITWYTYDTFVKEMTFSAGHCTPLIVVNNIHTITALWFDWNNFSFAVLCFTCISTNTSNRYILPRVHNIYCEGEYPTLYYPVKKTCVKSYAIPSRRLRRYKGLLIGVEWRWYITRQVSAYASAVCNNWLYDKHWLAF